jgi:DnaJ-class molecular chaperone
MELLELTPEAGLEEVRQAYKDLASVWHPDRFTGNPRLRQRAEERMKELNLAYETLVGRFGTSEGVSQGVKAQPKEPRGREDPERGGATEAVFELGTELFLRACYFLYTSGRRLMAEAGKERPAKRNP